MDAHPVEDTVYDPTPKPSRLQRIARGFARWSLRSAVVAGLLVATPGLATGAVLFPYVMDDIVLDRAVRAVALDWRDFGRSRAEQRLAYELDHQGIGLQVGDRDCTFDEQGGDRIVACTWSASFRISGMDRDLTLPFRSRAVMTPSGDLQ